MTGPRARLAEAGLRPKRSFGQCFLVNAGVAETIARACVPDGARATLVIEIGAGTGALTAPLLLRARKVIAIERDRDLIPVLQRAFGDDERLVIVEADAQTVSLEPWLSEPPAVLCGNLPYQITGVLLERATVIADRIARAVFMVQAEVADRLIAAPKTKAYGALTVFVRAAYDVERIASVSRGSFSPMPDVASAVVRLTPRASRIPETTVFRGLVRRAFQQRRKTLRNAWSGIAGIEGAAERAGVSLGDRGETLTVDSFAAVATALASSSS